MDTYDISIIVPVYNAENYIGECIDSLLAQTKDSIEIVVVNDGSTDLSTEIIKRYMTDNKSIVCVSQERGGLNAARIAGLKKAKGKFIGWVDADDFVRPEMYGKLYKLLRDNNADLAYCNVELYPQPSRFKKKAWFKEYKGVRDWRFIDRNCQCWHFLASSELLRDMNICELFAKYEEAAYIPVMLNARKIVYTTDQLYCYRVGHQSMSGGFNGKVSKAKRDAEVAKRYKDIVAGTQYADTLGSYMEYLYIYQLIILVVISAINEDRDEYLAAVSKLKDLDFRKNENTRTILDYNHGRIRSFVLRDIMTMSYPIARTITKIIFN